MVSRKIQMRLELIYEPYNFEEKENWLPPSDSRVSPNPRVDIAKFTEMTERLCHYAIPSMSIPV